MPNIKKTVLKYALQNAVRYKGKAQLNNVIPKVIGEIPSVRSDMTFLISTINKTIKEVTSDQSFIDLSGAKSFPVLKVINLSLKNRGIERLLSRIAGKITLFPSLTWLSDFVTVCKVL